MKEHARKLLDKALDSIEVAEGILDMNKPDMAAGRAYYAIFYIAEALLYEKVWNSVHMVRLSVHMEKFLQKQRNLILNFIKS